MRMRTYQPCDSIASLSMIGDANDNDLENGNNWIESTNPP